ncbi:MAG TPA: right-handed parallel beta-helix repeat-containing protein, partial [Acidimicrobiales bacterium]|nr:right-handed parallel beta-helix repeat-containing protein [Acidimicrobiales bacterium]
NHVVRKVDAAGTITTVAGIGFGGVNEDRTQTYVGGYGGDGGPATQAQLKYPSDVDVHGATLYIADTRNQRIRKVDASGTITTVAGTGDTGYYGDGGPATDAFLALPEGLAVDSSGDLFIADVANNRVRRLDAAGTITTVAGTGDDYGSLGDGGPATKARINNPRDVDVDPAGNLYVADTNRRVRAVGALSVSSADAPDPVPTGGALTYTLTVGNFSSVTARAVDLVDTLPAGARFRSATPSQGSCSRSKATVRCTLGDLPAGGAATVRIDVNAPSEPGVVANTATMVATHPDRLLVDNTTREQSVVTLPDVLLAKDDSPDPAQVGRPLTYTLTVTNALAGKASGVTVVDTLPSEVAFGSATPSQGRCSHASGTVSCKVGTIGYGGTATVAINVTPLRPGVVSNTATVRVNEADSFPANNTATAATTVSAASCERVITQTTVLTEDIGPCGGNGVIVRADNITLDLGGHRIFGFPGPGNGRTSGIRLPMRTGVTVKNGTVSHFDAGVVLMGGGSNTITELSAEDNVGPDDVSLAELGDGIVLFNSSNNTIVRNKVLRNGIYDGIGLIGGDADGNVIEDNLVEDTLGPSDKGPAGQGIILNSHDGDFDGLSIAGARVSRNVVTRSASAGISNINNTKGEISSNLVEGNGRTNAPGNGIGVQLGPASRDVSTELIVKDNTVRGNGTDGIHVVSLATGNQILNNIVVDNAVANTAEVKAFVDLRDRNPACAGNVWFGNTWGSGFFNPACTTAGGTGPLPPTPPTQDPADVTETYRGILRRLPTPQ